MVILIVGVEILFLKDMKYIKGRTGFFAIYCFLIWIKDENMRSLSSLKSNILVMNAIMIPSIVDNKNE